MNNYFDLVALEKVCKEYNYKYSFLSENELIVHLNEEISLEFVNLIKENENYIGFDSGDHFHGIDIIFTFFANKDFYEYHINYLNLIPHLHNRELFIRSTYKNGQVTSRYLFHKNDIQAVDPKYYLKLLVENNIDEIRVNSIP